MVSDVKPYRRVWLSGGRGTDGAAGTHGDPSLAADSEKQQRALQTPSFSDELEFIFIIYLFINFFERESAWAEGAAEGEEKPPPQREVRSQDPGILTEPKADT